MAQIASIPLGRRMAEVVAHATETLGGKQNAMAWLDNPNAAFGGRTPFDILAENDPAEVDELDQQLTALDYGMHP